MSKRSKKKDYQPFNIILVIVILFILTPIIPFLFGLLLLMRFVNLKGKYGVIVSGIGLLIIGAFFNEIQVGLSYSLCLYFLQVILRYV